MSERFELIAPCHFGLESVLKREIYDLGYEITSVEDGRVSFIGDAEAVARANIGLRTAERVLLNAGSFAARTWDELYEGTRALPLERYLPADAKFWVTKASSVKSRLFSPSDIQSVMKKAMVDRLSGIYHVNRFPETGASFPFRVFLKKDIVTVGIDTTGESLHKRGYRKASVRAPIAEILAAALLKLTPWKPGQTLVDPFCGSGTFLIEAALMSAGIAPGMHRGFTAADWTQLIAPGVWNDAYEEARESVRTDVAADLQGYDIDAAAIDAARENARLAGVADLVHFQVRPVAELSSRRRNGIILTNPPYGQRLTGSLEGGSKLPVGTHPKKERLERAREADDAQTALSAQQLQLIYRTLGERFRALDSWSLYLITAYENAEHDLGLKAAKNRKIYNGMIRTYFYMFPGAGASRRKLPKEEDGS